MRRLALLGILLVCAVALAGCYGEGFHAVGSPLTSTHMPPGLWRSLGGNGCTWSRISSSQGVVGVSTHGYGPEYMQVVPGDNATAIHNCLPFWQQPGPFAKPLVQPGQPFGDGDFLTNYEVNPGWYTATFTAGTSCTWSVMRGFHGAPKTGTNADVIRSGRSTSGSASVVITADDYGFSSQGCGKWVAASGPLPAAPGGAATAPVQTAAEGVSGTTVQDFPDPTVLRVVDSTQCPGQVAPCYYAFSTASGYLGLDNVPVVSSTDPAGTWTWAGPDTTTAPIVPSGDAMPNLAPWVQFGGNWAPSVIAPQGNTGNQKYVMYYTAKSKTASAWGGKECVGLATSATPDGPYIDTSSSPFLCQAAGTIDPNAFVDPNDGSITLTYANAQSGTTIYAQHLNPGGLSLAGGEVQLLSAVGGYSWEQGQMEGPSMARSAASGLLLFYSSGDYTTPTYSVGVARCDTPLGPCRRIYSTPVLASRGSMLGTGGQTPFQLTNGSWAMAFHAWDSVVGYPAGERALHILPLTFPGGNPEIG